MSPLAPRLQRLVKFGLGAMASGIMVAMLAACATNPYPALGDSAPHSAVARAHQMPIQGIDISHHQGDIDWNMVARSGIRFAFIKATDGGDHVDTRFMENWREARAAGIPRSGYHFIYWCRSAEDQLANYIRNVPNEPDALPPVLDLEWNNHSSCRPTQSRAELLVMIRTILNGLEAHYEKVPIIYTDINFHRDVLAGEHFDNPMWLRSVAAEPHERYGQRPFTFWQYTQTGTVPGIRGGVDRNAFFGTQQQWIEFFNTGCDPRVWHQLIQQGRCGATK